MKRFFLSLSLPMILIGCSSTPLTTADAGQPTAAKTAPAPATANAAPAGETDAQKLDRIVKTLAANSIYFDYDDFSIKQQYRQMLVQDFEAMKAAPAGSTFQLAGNADERGGTEYNLALGQKRAEAVKRALALLGMPESKMEAVSFGREKPRATCHEEKCWAENRRVDLSAKR